MTLLAQAAAASGASVVNTEEPRGWTPEQVKQSGQLLLATCPWSGLTNMATRREVPKVTHLTGKSRPRKRVFYST